MPDLQFTDYISKTEHSKTQQNAWSPIHRLEVLFKYWKFCEFVDDIRILNNLGKKQNKKYQSIHTIQVLSEHCKVNEFDRKEWRAWKY